MSEISRFHGIVIKMFHLEHGPPHFHAHYGGHKISVLIWSGVVRGRFPPSALRHVHQWYHLHQAELMRNWERARHAQPLERIDPLE